MKIWKKYFLRELSKVFFLFIFCFYFLYILIDYTSRTGAMISGFSHIGDIIFYYLLMFMKRLDMMLPFALLIASIRALLTLNTHNELVALLASGMRLKTLLRPFLAVALTCVALLYVNYELIIPSAWNRMKKIEDRYSSEGGHSRQIQGVQDITLADGSTVIYQSYDSARGFFFDSYWLRSIDEIYRIKYLFPHTDNTVGRKVDRLIRDENGNMAITESFDTKILSELRFDPELLTATLRLPEEMSLKQLWQRIPKRSGHINDKEAGIVSRFYLRLSMPWLCLLVVLATAPFCVQFSRHPPILLIYILSILGLVTFYLIMDAAIVVGNAQVIPPALAIFTPFVLYYGLFGYRWVAMR